MSTVLVTGAGRGIGRAITEEFIRRGHRVIGTARDPRSLQDLDLAQRLALDVTDDASVTAAFAAAGDVDIVVINPADIFYAAVEAIPLAELQRLFNLNTVGALRVAQAALPACGPAATANCCSCPASWGGSRCRPERRTRRRSGRWKRSSNPWRSRLHSFGVQAILLEPGAVSSGALDDVTTYTLPDDPYAGLAGDEVRATR